MKGFRLPDETDFSSDLPHGSYWRRDGRWYCITPNGHFGDVSKHTVTEHEDRTLTVSPSILVSTTSPNKGNSVELWHGFLERGVWREC